MNQKSKIKIDNIVNFGITYNYYYFTSMQKREKN